MANILMINLPFTGHTNPTLPLAKTLVQRGHNVSYVNAEEFRTKIEITGAKFIPYTNYPSSPTMQQKKTKSFRAAFDTAISLEQKFDLLIYEMFFYPGIKIAERLGIPCVRQFSQPAWNEYTTSDKTWLFRLSGVLIDFQVMGKKNKTYMELANKALAKAIIYDKPLLNIVYVPQVFQTKRETFGKDFVFNVPASAGLSTSQQIPFKTMKPPIIPKASSLKQTLAEYRNAMEVQDEFSFVSNMETSIKTELFEAEMEGNIYQLDKENAATPCRCE